MGSGYGLEQSVQGRLKLCMSKTYRIRITVSADVQQRSLGDRSQAAEQ